MLSKVSPTLEPIKLVGKILEIEMELPQGQLMLGLENFFIPANDGLYVAMFYGAESVIGNNSAFETRPDGGVNELQEVVMLHEIALDVMSFNSEARLRKEEVLQALASVTAQNMSDKYFMRIYNVPTSFLVAPSLEETKNLNRFRITFAVDALHRKIKESAYYDTVNPPEVTHNA